MSVRIEENRYPTRREFVQLATTAAFIGGRLSPLPREAPPRFDRYPRAEDPQLRELAAHALDAAKTAGATYVEVRFTLTEEEGMACGQGMWGQHWTRNRGDVGVRALAQGAWGFTSSTLWTAEELARLGHEAAEQARTNGRGRRRQIEWTPRPAVTGRWVASVKIDPFAVSLAEKIDVGLSWIARVEDRASSQYRYGGTMAGFRWRARRQETTLISSEGSALTQTRYFLHPMVSATWKDTTAFRRLERLQPCAGGWEVMNDPTLYDEIPRLLEESALRAEREVPDPGRYDIVCDATVTAHLLAQTVGLATELDRVLGYEANAGGTSYLAPPDEILGQFALGPASLSVTADRTIPGLTGTTRWDDEGVEPEAYPVIANGIVVGYHTNRELAPELAAWDAKRGSPVRSRGCAVAASGRDLPVIRPPNLLMTPPATDTTFAEMVAGLEHGIVFVGSDSPLTEREAAGVMERPSNQTVIPRPYRGSVMLDRQQLNGELTANFVYEVRHGKRVRTLGNVEALFRTPDLWKNLQAIGGRSTQMDAGYVATKGEPAQEAAFSVRACATRFKQVAVTDSTRKA